MNRCPKLQLMAKYIHVDAITKQVDLDLSNIISLRKMNYSSEVHTCTL